MFKEILAKKYKILIAAFAVAIVSVIYYSTLPFSYRSTVTFYINADAEFDDTALNSKGLGSNHLIKLSKSTQMVDYLIDKFNLYDHYNIDHIDGMPYENISALLLKNIVIRRSKFNSISITVYDNDKVIAANIANELFNKLDSINHDYIVSIIGKKVKIYKQLLDSAGKQSQMQMCELQGIVEDKNSLNPSVNNFKTSKNNSLTNYRKIDLICSQLYATNNDLLKISGDNDAALAAIRKENLPELQLLNKALPDLRSPVTGVVSWILVPFIIASLFCSGLIIVLYSYKVNSKGLSTA